jgi:hypothetical protein
MYLDSNEIEIIETAKKYLTAFLKDMQQFYPFALIMSKDGIIHTIEPENIEENDIVNNLISLYETSFQKELNKNKQQYILAIICIDIIVIKGDIKTSAIKIRIMSKNVEKVVFLPYNISKMNDIEFGNLYGA